MAITHAVVHVTQGSVGIVHVRGHDIVLVAKQVICSSSILLFIYMFNFVQVMFCLVQKMFLYVETLVIRCE